MSRDESITRNDKDSWKTTKRKGKMEREREKKVKVIINYKPSGTYTFL